MTRFPADYYKHCATYFVSVSPDSHAKQQHEQHAILSCTPRSTGHPRPFPIALSLHAVSYTNILMLAEWGPSRWEITAQDTVTRAQLTSAEACNLPRDFFVVAQDAPLVGRGSSSD